MNKFFFCVIIICFFSCQKEDVAPSENENSNSSTNLVPISGLSKIDAIDCNNYNVSGKLNKDQASYGLYITIPYSGGNGKAYSSQSIASTGVTGLQATLNQGNLAYGQGQFIYNITGTPTSEGSAQFLISFGGKNCSISIPVENTDNDATISYFDCDNAKISGTLIKNQVLNNVKATVSYSGGNGKYFSAKKFTSTGVTGLSAILSEGYLSFGQGELTFSIFGTPTSSGIAQFDLIFGGRTCKISIEVSASSIIQDVEGNTYSTIQIGNQLWMASNLKTKKYSDGSLILNVTDNTKWSNNNTGAWCYYDNNTTNDSKYGKLYNWYALSRTTNGNRNICPTGWHVPSFTEWNELIGYLGGDAVAGGKLKDTGTLSWFSPNTAATNSSLFTALPGGLRNSDGSFNFTRYYGFWWSTTDNDVNASIIGLGYNNGDVLKFSDSKKIGMSVRCLKD